MQRWYPSWGVARSDGSGYALFFIPRLAKAMADRIPAMVVSPQCARCGAGFTDADETVEIVTDMTFEGESVHAVVHVECMNDVGEMA